MRRTIGSTPITSATIDRATRPRARANRVGRAPVMADLSVLACVATACARVRVGLMPLRPKPDCRFRLPGVVWLRVGQPFRGGERGIQGRGLNAARTNTGG